VLSVSVLYFEPNRSVDQLGARDTEALLAEGRDFGNCRAAVDDISVVGKAKDFRL
jgi:hypothetical protein